MDASIKKIVILGPESTGKSTLCRQLAAHYNTLWCPEFAREYLLKHGMNYTYDDLLTIAKGQLALEDGYSARMGDSLPSLTSHHSPFFIDTDMYIMKVWCEFVFNRCHKWILEQIAERKYDLYLLCNTDLPWVVDELREYPDLKTRERLFCMYKDSMINQSVPWTVIEGNPGVRLSLAIKAVDKILFRL